MEESWQFYGSETNPPRAIGDVGAGWLYFLKMRKDLQASVNVP